MRPSSAVIGELERLYQQHGELTPRIVLDAAMEPESPLHDQFEWDYELAGEAWWLHQAAALIRRARIRIITNSTPSAISVRAFISIPTDDGRRVYRPHRIVSEDVAMREQALQDMAIQWRALRRKWETYSEFWVMVFSDVPPTATKRRKKAS